jgi:hypothetical protein
MRAQFVGETITVELADIAGRPPSAIEWRGERHAVELVEATWHDASWGPLRARVKRWWQRRHRTYFQLRVRGGRIFEVYHDRGLDRWVLYRILHLQPEP